MPKPTPFTKMENKKHPHYWKVKAAFLESRQVAITARATMDAANAKLAQVMRDAGLDPQKLYQFADDNETITLAPKGAALPAV